jgi:hypothetical protein
VQAKQAHKRPQVAADLPGELLRVGLSLAAGRLRVCRGGHEGEGLHELGLELHNPGGQRIVVGDGSITFEREVLGLGY